MKNFKQFILLVVCLIMVMGVCGCMNMSKKYTVEEIAKILGEKYDDTFTFVSSGSELWTADYSEMVYVAEKLDTRVIVWVYEDGKMRDNYMALKYKTDVEELIFPIAEEIYGECQVVNIPLHYGREHFTSDMSLEQYVSNASSSIYIVIATNKKTESAREDATVLFEKFKENSINARIRISYYDVSDIKEIAKTGETSTPFAPDSVKNLRAEMNIDYSIAYMNWSE